MITGPKLTKGQYLYFSSTARTIAEAIIIGSSAAFFLPEALQLEHRILATRYLALILVGLFFLLFGAILQVRSEHDRHK